MSLVVHFSPDLGSWLVQNLDRGTPAAILVRTMIEERMDPRVARSIVDAFVDARRVAGPLPVDSVIIEEEAPTYVNPAPMFRPGSRIATNDRAVRVMTRMDDPVLALLGNVLSDEECAELIELARPRLTPSTIVDPVTGQDRVVDHRSSLGMFFRLEENPFIARLDRRISEVMNLPVENGEGFQVLCYPEGAENAPHFDFLVPSNAANRASIARSGQRVSTLIAYLNDVERGGETLFPAAGWTTSPARGNAVYFEYSNEAGDVDHRSLHAGSRVLTGEKWVATKWMRRRRFVSAGARPSEGMMPTQSR